MESYMLISYGEKHAAPLFEEDPNVFELSEDKRSRSEISTPVREEVTEGLPIGLKLEDVYTDRCFMDRKINQGLEKGP